MSIDWPDGMRIKPIITWPGEQSRSRISSPFRANWSQTIKDLRRELSALNARNVTLQVAISPAQFRVDGYPRRDARADHPGVILTFDSKHGPLSYPCDRFFDWRDNLRAVALAMEALRKVDRYGVTKRGEQYAGWKQLPAGNGKTSRAEAQALIDGYGGRAAAIKAAHPDRGGDRAQWDRVDEALRVLEAATP